MFFLNFVLNSWIMEIIINRQMDNMHDILGNNKGHCNTDWPNGKPPHSTKHIGGLVKKNDKLSFTQYFLTREEMWFNSIWEYSSQESQETHKQHNELWFGMNGTLGQARNHWCLIEPCFRGESFLNSRIFQMWLHNQNNIGQRHIQKPNRANEEERMWVYLYCCPWKPTKSLQQ